MLLPKPSLLPCHPRYPIQVAECASPGSSSSSSFDWKQLVNWEASPQREHPYRDSPFHSTYWIDKSYGGGDEATSSNPTQANALIAAGIAPTQQIPVPVAPPAPEPMIPINPPLRSLFYMINRNTCLFPSYVRLLRILHKHGGREQARSSIGCSRMNATSGTFMNSLFLYGITQRLQSQSRIKEQEKHQASVNSQRSAITGYWRGIKYW